MSRDGKSFNRHEFTGRRTLVRTGFIVAAVLLLCVAILILFPPAFLQEFIGRRVSERFASSHPEYSLRISGMRIDVLRNRISCDSLLICRTDSSLVCRVGSLSVAGIRWLDILHGDGIEPRAFGSFVVEAGSVAASFPLSGYGFRCGPVHVSVPDSEITADAIDLRPLGSDDEFFSESRFRKTRLGLALRRFSLSGFACVDVLLGGKLLARTIHLQDAVFDVLINKDKPAGKDNAGPRMPAEILSSIRDTVGLDSLIITGGHLEYGERMVVGRKPAMLVFDGVQMAVTGIASHPLVDTEAGILASGMFRGGGTMTLAMSIPLSRRQCSFRFSGTLGEMGLKSLNSFVEVSDNMRIKTGKLASAAFNIKVRDGSATGTVRAVYTDLVIAAIDARTGSESGVIDRYASWISKNVKIRGSNTPDRSGAMKVGRVKYTRMPSDPFLGFAWFALRSGVGDVVGF